MTQCPGRIDHRVLFWITSCPPSTVHDLLRINTLPTEVSLSKSLKPYQLTGAVILYLTLISNLLLKSSNKGPASLQEATSYYSHFITNPICNNMLLIENNEGFSSTSWPVAFTHHLHGKETEGKNCVKKQIWVIQFLLSKGRHTKTSHMHVRHSGFCSLNMWVWAYSGFPELYTVLIWTIWTVFYKVAHLPFLSCWHTNAHRSRHTN